MENYVQGGLPALARILLILTDLFKLHIKYKPFGLRVSSFHRHRETSADIGSIGDTMVDERRG